MDTVNYEMVKQINKELIATQEQTNSENANIYNRNKKLIKRLEELSNNANIKYLNFKMIGGSLAIGLLLGALAVGGYSYYKVHQALKKVKNIQTTNKEYNSMFLQEEKKLALKTFPDKYYCTLTNGWKGICIPQKSKLHMIISGHLLFVRIKK